MSKKLGKGLEAIFGEGLEKAIGSIENNHEKKLEIEIDKIRLNPYQPRKSFDEEKLQELAQSIKTHGVFQPILVRETVDGYELIAGERRLRASKMANLIYIPAVIVEFNDQQMMEIALLENIQRENLSVIEEAQAYEKLMTAHQYTQESLANRLGKSRSYVANVLRLLKLPQPTQQLVMDRKLTMGHVRALLPLENENLIVDISEKIIQENLSVREVEDLIKRLLSDNKKVVKMVDERFVRLQDMLQEKLQTSVKVDQRQLVIKYTDNSDLNRILEILGLLEE